MSVAVTVYSTPWCSDCSRSKRLLRRAGVAFEEINIENSEDAENAMRSLNGGSGKVPTILLQNGMERRILVEPSDTELKHALCQMGGVGEIRLHL